MFAKRINDKGVESKKESLADNIETEIVQVWTSCNDSVHMYMLNNI